MVLHTQILGEGKPIVIVHGFLGMGDNWKSIAKQLAFQNYEVHLPDMRNHGKSPHSDDFSYDLMADDMIGYFNQQNLQNVVLIGHSMGGKIAMNFASKHPELLSHLIVVDIAPKYYEPHHDDILMSLQALKDKKLNSRKEAENILKETIDNVGLRLFLLKNLKRKEDNTLELKPNIDVFINNRDNVGQALDEYKSFHGLTCFIRGEKSDYILDEDLPSIKKQFPFYRLVTIPSSGHWVHAENPKLFLKSCIDFISK